MVTSVLFVCTGNICRSPTAEGVFRARVQERCLDFSYDSCGTHGYHVGEGADERSVAAALKYGVDMSDLRARQLHTSDFEVFDYLIAMDKGHERIMRGMCPPEYLGKIKILLNYTDDFYGMDVPDPYYGSLKGFDEVYVIIEAGVNRMIEVFTSHL
ncbi:MAG: low molecular weight protein-tyrosine-phosphatase [Alphaproteobacteria bacterium]